MAFEARSRAHTVVLFALSGALFWAMRGANG
jgi:hypothetical protein